MDPEEEGGAPVTQAGKHPFQVTGTLTLNQVATTQSVKGDVEGHPVALAKDLAGLLPPGLIGNPTPFPKCSVTQLIGRGGCPPQSVIGIASVTVNEPVSFGGLSTFTLVRSWIWNRRMGRPRGSGSSVRVVPVYLDARVRSGGDYGVTLSSAIFLRSRRSCRIN